MVLQVSISVNQINFRVRCLLFCRSLHLFNISIHFFRDYTTLRALGNKGKSSSSSKLRTISIESLLKGELLKSTECREDQFEIDDIIYKIPKTDKQHKVRRKLKHTFEYLFYHIRMQQNINFSFNHI